MTSRWQYINRSVSALITQLTCTFHRRGSINSNITSNSDGHNLLMQRPAEQSERRAPRGPSASGDYPLHRQTEVTAYLKSKQLLLFACAGLNWIGRSQGQFAPPRMCGEQQYFTPDAGHFISAANMRKLTGRAVTSCPLIQLSSHFPSSSEQHGMRSFLVRILLL